MKTKHIIPLWMLALLFVLQLKLSAQPETSIFADWSQEDKAAVEALVMYPQTTRTAILEAAQYPELLIKVEGMQTVTSSKFQELIADLDQEKQATIYDISRYPGLLSRLALAKESGQQNIKPLLEDYPEVIHVRAREAYRNYGDLLQQIDQLQLQADQQFNELIATYPAITREAMRELIELPEVLSLLTENIRMTILVGDLHQKDPIRLQQQMDSLNVVVAEANAKELENWKESVKSDPEVRTELKSATEEFAEEYGYDDDYYDYDDMYYEEEREREKYVVEQYFYYNYPYWFGFPRWYYYPRWRPYPIWYESGFYVVLDGTFVIHRLPSFYFTSWYFHRPYHHYYYPHLSRRFIRHTYYGPRPGTSSITVSVRNWQERNRELITDNWLRDDRNSIQRLREYGKFELDRAKYNQRKLEKELSQKEYLERHRNRYPSLTRSSAATRSRQLDREQPATRPRPKTDVPLPQKKPNERVVPRQRTDPPSVDRERIRTQPRTRKVEPPKVVPKVKRGVDQHRRTIERSKATRPKVTPRKAPRTIPRAKPKTTPKTKKTRKKGNG